MKTKHSGSDGLKKRMERDALFHMRRGRSFEQIVTLTGYSRFQFKPIYLRVRAEFEAEQAGQGKPPGHLDTSTES